MCVPSAISRGIITDLF